MAAMQRGGDVQKLLDANDKMLYTWKTLLDSRRTYDVIFAIAGHAGSVRGHILAVATLDKKDEYKEWHVKCVRYKEQIARSLERLAALADDQIAKKDATTSSGPATTTTNVPATTAAPHATAAAAAQLQQKQLQQHQHQLALQKQQQLQQLQLQKQQQAQQQAAAAAAAQQKKQQQQQLQQLQQLQQQQQAAAAQQQQSTSTATAMASAAGFPPGTDLATMQLAMSQMMPMGMNPMMTGATAADMSNLFLMGDQLNQAQLNQMNMFNFNMQAAAYGNQMYNPTTGFNPALMQSMMYPNQVLQAQMAAAAAAGGMPFPMGGGAASASASGPPSAADAWGDQDTVKNVMDDFMSPSE
ncbi:Aste57867_21040 [Aphanomyces stellatus]|uniref:Aste57867_21040 protein n=1 Tax=Aphanomyces stellatus TaxID=120398 RepID=A0A485LH80_9STRA|nr:hypothetical protein As57867_020972 [Aphanomyces stellatus]VFT97715.1 Aste57867_21040 [Aphanomyces stellatus]